MKPMKFLTHKTLKLVTEPDGAWKEKLLLLQEPDTQSEFAVT